MIPQFSSPQTQRLQYMDFQRNSQPLVNQVRVQNQIPLIVQPSQLPKVQTQVVQVQQKQPVQQNQVIKIQPSVQTPNYEVVDLFAREAQWNSRISQLEREIEAIKSNRNQAILGEQTKVENSNIELNQVYEQIQQLQKNKQFLEAEYQNSVDQNSSLDRRITSLQQEIQNRDDALDRLNNSVELLQEELEDTHVTRDDEFTYLYLEINTWKDKFTNLQKEHEDTKEQLGVAEQELNKFQEANKSRQPKSQDIY